MIYYIPWTDRIILVLDSVNKTVFQSGDDDFCVGAMRNKESAVEFGWVYIGEL